MSPIFDTLKLSQRLEQGGFSRQQANAQAEALSELLIPDALGTATQSDLHALEKSLINEIDSRFEKFSIEMNISIREIDLRAPFSLFCDAVGKQRGDVEELCADRQLRVELEELRTDVRQLRVALEELRTDVRQLRVELEELRTDVRQLRVDVEELRTDMRELRLDITELRKNFAVLTSEVGMLKWLMGLTLLGTCATLAKQWLI